MSDRSDPLSAMEDLRLGLQYLDNEEENLMILKSHLSKIKKIREEQIRKEGIVEVLHDRVAVLEKELTTATRQSTEIQEILTERISFLESSLKGKDELEVKYAELIRYSEHLSEQNNRLTADLKSEAERTKEFKQMSDQKDIEITKCRAETSLEKQKVSQLQILFETFKSELMHKEDVIGAQHRNHVEHDKELNQALSIANATIDDLSQQLNKAEEKVGRLMAELSFCESEGAVSKKDLLHHDRELNQWKEMYSELEAVLLKVKGQLLLTQQSHENEVALIRSELESSKVVTGRYKQDLNEVQSTLASIAQDVRMIHTLDQQHKAVHRGGGGGSSSKMHNAQIMALALSLQKTVSANGSAGIFHPTSAATAGVGSGKGKRHTGGSDASRSSTNGTSSNGSNSSSLVVGIEADISVIVHNVCDLIYRIFAQEEEESDLKTELRQRTESVQSSSAYCVRLEQTIVELQEDLRRSDEAVKLLVDYFTQGRLVLSKASHLSASSAAASGAEWEVGEEEEVGSDVFGGVDYLAGGSPSSVRAAATPTASTALRESIHAINSEARALLLDSLYNSLRSSLHSMLLLEQEKSDVLKRLQGIKVKHTLDKEELTAAHDKKVSLLEKEISQLRQTCENCAIAVKCAEFEAQQEVTRIRQDYERERRSMGRVGGVSDEVMEMRSQLASYQTRYTQVTLSLEHTLQYVASLRQQLESLQSVYGLSTSLYQQLARAQATLVSEIHTLAHSFSDLWEDDSGNLILHADPHASSSSRSSSGGGRLAASRPEASSRRQRYSKYHPSTATAVTGSPYSPSLRRYSSHHRLTLRSLVIFVLAANRFRRFRVEGLQRRRHNPSGSNSNLLAVAATSAKLDSPSKYQQQVDAHEFVALYPAFSLPSVRILTTAPCEAVVNQLLLAAECLPAALSDVSFTYGRGEGASLLEDIKLKQHRFLWWKETAGLNELYSIERQLSHLTHKLQNDQLQHRQQQQQQQQASRTSSPPPKSPNGAIGSGVGRSVQSSTSSLHVLPSHGSPPSPVRPYSSPSALQREGGNVGGDGTSRIHYRYSGNGGPSGVVVRNHLASASVNFISSTNTSLEEARDSSVMMTMLDSSVVDFDLSRSTWRGLSETHVGTSTAKNTSSSSSSSSSGSHNDHDAPSGFIEDEEAEGSGSSGFDEYDADLRAIAEAQYTPSYPVFQDTSASQLLNDTTSNEILEIYSDIGRLTGKLKMNSRLSSTT